MKKSLVLAMAMALGVTASAYAANPFSDVPAGHWAYDSIAKLAAAGVIEGYGDDTFRGDRLMTRFEMAQIVAKAMSKGSNVDKLAAEFADELDALGVRVAALEKKSDNVKITGEARFHYGQYGKYAKAQAGKEEHGIRTRLYFNGKINDNWNYVGRIQNQQLTTNNVGDEDTEFNIAKLEGRLGGVNVIAGRDDDVFADGYIYDGEHDAIKLSYGDKWYVSGAYGKLTDLNDDSYFQDLMEDLTGNRPDVSKKFYTVEIGTNLDSFANGKVGYLKANTTDAVKAQGVGNVGIWYAGADFKLGEDFGLNAMYLRTNRNPLDVSKKNGYVVGLSYKGAEADEPGTWGLSANYYNQGRFTYLAHTIDGWTDYRSGFKGWSLGGEVTVARNMVLSTAYYDTKALKNAVDGPDTKAKVWWNEFNVMF